MTTPLAILTGALIALIQPIQDASPVVQATEQPSGANNPQTQPAITTQPTDIDCAELAKRAPVVRNMRFDHPEPTTAQLENILRSAVPRCPNGQEIWFIHLRANWKSKDGRRAVATVYFTPDKRAERLRAGYYTYAASTPPAWQQMLLRIDHELAEPAGEHRQRRAPHVYRYWQVSRSDQPFREELTVPDESLLPFAVPEGFTEEEVIEIVDFLRSGPSEEPDGSNASGYPRTLGFPQRLDGAQPIHSIERRDGVIEVRTGVQQDMLAGQGEILRCRKRDDGTFEVLSLGMWIS